ncbi:hypothetical protein C8J57DRAFT_1499652 [Mycena rebaudengoi]|nr:hypothetical protein C8J57DRAFT_1499652 [Mycena rebaudengoi]
MHNLAPWVGVDDTDPSVRYLASRGDVEPDVCIGCRPRDPALQYPRLFNRTATEVAGLVEFSFLMDMTVTQFFVFALITPNHENKGTVPRIIQIDGGDDRYNYTRPSTDLYIFQSPFYTSSFLPDGKHTIRMQVDWVYAYFDFFTSDVTLSNSGSTGPTQTSTGPPTETAGVVKKAKAPVGASCWRSRPDHGGPGCLRLPPPQPKRSFTKEHQESRSVIRKR